MPEILIPNVDDPEAGEEARKYILQRFPFLKDEGFTLISPDKYRELEESGRLTNNLDRLTQQPENGAFIFSPRAYLDIVMRVKIQSTYFAFAAGWEAGWVARIRLAEELDQK